MPSDAKKKQQQKKKEAAKARQVGNKKPSQKTENGEDSLTSNITGESSTENGSLEISVEGR